MFEFNLYQRVLFQSEPRSENLHAHRYIAAIDLFRSSVFKGRLSRVVKKILHKPCRLYDFDLLKPQVKLLGGSYLGLRTVSIDDIIGTEGKADDFDADFHPFSEEARERWVNIALLHFSCVPLPPVALLKVGDVHFVRDGHHRISVARALGQKEVDAEVIAWRASPPFPWKRRTVLRPIHMSS